MKLDMKEIEHDFTTWEIDGLVLVNPREIGIEVALENLETDVIYQSDLYYEIEQYLADIVNEAFDCAVTTLRENNRDIDSHR